MRYVTREPGTWRQIFGSVMLPSSAHDGRPMIANLSDIVSRAFGVTLSGEAWQYATVAILALIVLLAAVSLFLPFVLRASRMMWVVSIAGLATSLLSAAVVVAVELRRTQWPVPVPSRMFRSR